MPTLDRSKAAYLKLAVELVAEGGAASSVDAVSIADVAAEMKVSRQTLYRMWGSQTEFHDALLDWVSEQPFTVSGYDLLGVSPAWSGRDAAGVDLHTVISTRCDRAQPLIATNPRIRVDLSTLAFRRSNKLEIDRHRAHHELVGQLTEQVERYLRFESRVVRAPIGSPDIAALIWSVAIGLNYLSRFPGFVVPTSRLSRSQGSADVSVLALSVLALLDGLTELSPDSATSQTSHPPEIEDERFAPAVPGAGPSRARSMSSWSAEQRHVLEQSALILDDRLLHPLADTVPSLGELSLTRLARHAKVSRRTIYNVWATQHEFETDLNDFVHNDQIGASRDRMRQVIAERGDDPRLLMELCDRMTEWRQQDASDRHRSFNYAYLRKQPAASGSLANQVDQYSGDLSELLTAYVVNQGLRIIDGVHPEAMGCALTALAVGSKAVHLLAPSTLRSHLSWRGGVYSAYAIGYQALTDFCLEPRKPRPV